MDDQGYLRRTFELALKGLGATWPNPLVGCVIVKDGRIIGEGFHRGPGLDHAELDALKNCHESPAGATVYVNLEPCCHTNKRTPPCAQRLIQEKIKKVVVSNLDPNPEVNGKGVELLRGQGIEVEHGPLREDGERLNEVFFLSQKQRRPFIHLKMASTLDGKTALLTGESRWITGERAREHVHFLRSIHQAVVVGANTVRQDDPRLDVRLPGFQGPQPKRIVFTESGNLPPSAKIFNHELRETTLIYSKTKLTIDHPKEQTVIFDNLSEAMTDLFERKFCSLMLEGGSNLAASFLRAQLIDRVSLYLNPSFIGVGVGVLGDLNLTSLESRPRLKNVESKWLGEDLYLTGTL